MRRKSSSPKYTGPTRASINRSKTPGWVDVHSPYNKDYVETLKNVIQASDRKWDPTLLVWHVNEQFLQELVDTLRIFFDEVTTDLVEPAPVRTENIFTPVFAELKGSPEAIDKVYKTLAFSLHPDRGGSNETMTKLNQAYQKAKK